MGQSTDAILFYGYCWDDENRYPWDDGEEEDWEERLAERLGAPSQPEAEYPSDKDKTPEAEALRKAFSVVWDARRQKRDSLNVAMSSHCSGECPIPFIHVKDGILTANRGYPKTVSALDVKPEWDAQLADFCHLMGITPPQESPRWWLVSYWN